MKLAILFLAAYLYFFCNGVRRPYYLILAYLWVSFIYPQGFLPPVFWSLPLPMVAGALAVFAYTFVDRLRLPRMTVVSFATTAFALWVTATTFIWPEFPSFAAAKWDWAIKSICLVLLMPVFLRTRQEIESAVLVIFFAWFAHIGTAAVKSLAGGGGYGSLATLIHTNSYLGESSTLAVIAIVSIPLWFYISRYSSCAEALPWPKLNLAAYTLLAIACMVGTSARSGLLSLFTLVLFAFRPLWQKAVLCTAFVVIGFIVFPYLPADWTSRMRTMESYQEDTSAEGRLEVWSWTYQYAKEHPFGGGFDVYRLNDLNGGEAKAFHSIYLELLGEQGFVGAFLYIIIALGSWLDLRRLSEKEALPDWLRHLSRTLFASFAVFSVGGAFIGVAYQPFSYGLFGIYLCMRQFIAENGMQGA